jgi:hypothetical protein
MRDGVAVSLSDGGLKQCGIYLISTIEFRGRTGPVAFELKDAASKRAGNFCLSFAIEAGRLSGPFRAFVFKSGRPPKYGRSPVALLDLNSPLRYAALNKRAAVLSLPGRSHVGPFTLNNFEFHHVTAEEVGIHEKTL